MMLNQSCDHVSGDDTNQNGYRLMIREDDECGCNVVRSITPGIGVGVSVDDQRNSLVIYNAKEDERLPRISGGEFVILRGWGGDSQIIQMIFTGIINLRDFGSANTTQISMINQQSVCVLNWIINGRELIVRRPNSLQNGFGMQPGESVFLTTDYSLTREGDNRNFFVLRTRDNIPERILTNKTVMLCYRDDSDVNNRFVHWLPTNVKIPFTVPNALDSRIATYDIINGRGSWTKDPDEIVEPVKPDESVMPFDFGKLMCHGGIITYTNVRTDAETDFAFIRWSENILSLIHISEPTRPY